MIEQKTVCHLSFNHNPFDDRIYWKELLTLKAAGFNVLHIAVGDQHKDFVTQEGVRIITVPRIKKFRNVHLNRLYQFIIKSGTVDYIFKIAASVKADVYHYHDLQINAIAKRLKALPHQPKFIYDAHEHYHLLLKEQTPKNSLTKPLYLFYINEIRKWELRQSKVCDHIITTDYYTCNYFKENLPNVPVTTVFNYSYFIPIQNKVNTRKFDFIYTGSLSKGRGISELIEATAELVKKFPNALLLLIGSFENKYYEKKVKDEIIQLNLNRNIELHNPVPFQEMAGYYKQSAIGIGLFHNTPKYSTFIPIKLFEYMAFGLPVVFADHGPSSDIIKKENCGICVKPMNISDIVQAMQSLLENKPLYNQYSQNALKAVEEKYTWEKEKHKLTAIYQNLLE